FEQTSHLLPNHLVTTDLSGLDLTPEEMDTLQNRTMVVRKTDRIDIECVVRAYIGGSGFKEDEERGTLAEEELPDVLRRADALPQPVFTPAIKNDDGHDENISRERLKEIVGADLATELETRSIEIYEYASRLASDAGIILADTKFEFGYIDGQL